VRLQKGALKKGDGDPDGEETDREGCETCGTKEKRDQGNAPLEPVEFDLLLDEAEEEGVRHKGRLEQEGE